MKLKTLLQRIALQRKEEFPFPDDLESYLEDFIPNHLLKSETLQQAFGISDYELEQLYEEAYHLYEEEKFLEAATYFRWLVFFNTYAEKFWMGLAACQQLLELYEKALHSYAVAALLTCEDPYPHFYAYECYTALEIREDAEKALKLAHARCHGKAAYRELQEHIELLLPKVEAACL